MIAQQRLHQLVDYDNGILRWKKNHSARARKGDALGWVHSNGYLDCSVDRKRYRVHRLVWLYFHGALPDLDIDHINGNRADNRIENLREAERFQNLGNMKMPRHNRSGVKGVFWDATRKKWCAQIQMHGRGTHLGRFDSIEDASAAYERAAQSHFGEFARCA